MHIQEIKLVLSFPTALFESRLRMCVTKKSLFTHIAVNIAYCACGKRKNRKT
jgi:hypothetical protein